MTASPSAADKQAAKAAARKPAVKPAVLKSETWVGRRVSLEVNDPVPFESVKRFWRAMAQPATIAMAVLMIGAFLYVARSMLLPVLCAVIVGLTIGPYVSAVTRRGVPAWLVALILLLLGIAAANIAVMLLAGPASEMLKRAPELANALKDKLTIFSGQMAALQELQNALGADASNDKLQFNTARMLEGLVTIVTPAAVQFILQVVLFVGTFFFFILGRASFRSQAVNLFASRDARLRTLKILNDIESNLSGYLVVVTAINLCLGLVAIGMAYALGLPYPILWGALAFSLNYVPYVGPSIMYVLLFFAGILTYPTLFGALIPPLTYIAITTIEGHFLTPLIVGRQVLQIHPLAIFLGIAFWAWLWGPLGAFLATPILIVARVAFDHLYPSRSPDLPG